MKIEFEITDEQRDLLLSLSMLLHSNDQVDLLVDACGGKTFPASTLSAAVFVLIGALELTEEARNKEQAQRDQLERLSCKLPSGGI
jgi:hypothetical protein